MLQRGEEGAEIDLEGERGKLGTVAPPTTHTHTYCVTAASNRRFDGCWFSKASITQIHIHSFLGNGVLEFCAYMISCFFF